MNIKQFFKDLKDEFLYLYGFGDIWKSQIEDDLIKIQKRNKIIKDRLKRKTRLKWIKKRK